MRNTLKRKRTLLVAMTVLLAACGGGGNDAPPPPPTPPVTVIDAFTSFVELAFFEIEFVHDETRRASARTHAAWRVFEQINQIGFARYESEEITRRNR